MSLNASKQLKKAKEKKTKRKKTSAYERSGVSVQAGDDLVSWLSQNNKSSKNEMPYSKNILSGVGGFASIFRMDLQGLDEPHLVTCTDGVGTKVLLASQFGGYEQVAQDMVAMCVNDLVTTGATPLLFLDYYASSKLNLKNAKKFLSGVRKACDESLCALVGGETAEMPGVYRGDDFDCAGFAVGVVDRTQILGAHLVQEGDVLIGISSSGFHSNGYSLLRKAFQKDLKRWSKKLLTPTHLYVKLALELKNIGVHAFAHITGGGVDNIPRVIPEDLIVELKAWEIPEEFLEAQKRMQMSTVELIKTLNSGIGFVAVTSIQNQQKIIKKIIEMGFGHYDLGVVKKRSLLTSDVSSQDIIFPKEFVPPIHKKNVLQKRKVIQKKSSKKNSFKKRNLKKRDSLRSKAPKPEVSV